jgi:uncharacterized protein YgiM (DUF1202 family)
MKNLILVFGFMVIITRLCFSQASGSVLYVAVKSANLKKSTGFFAGNIEELKLGDAVTVVSVNGKWVQVRSPDNQTGWALRDSFSTRKVVASGSATASEVALAGKGLTAEAETEFRRNGLDYTAVDEMEKIVVPPAELEQFIDDGRLKKGD